MYALAFRTLRLSMPELASAGFGLRYVNLLALFCAGSGDSNARRQRMVAMLLIPGKNSIFAYDRPSADGLSHVRFAIRFYIDYIDLHGDKDSAI